MDQQLADLVVAVKHSSENHLEVLPVASVKLMHKNYPKQKNR